MERMEIQQSPVKMVLMLLIADAFVALGGFMVWKASSTGNTLVQMVGWLGIIFFGFVAAFIAVQLFRTSRPVLVLDETGLLDRRLSVHPVPWAAIQRVGEWAYNGQKVIVLGVPPQTEAALGLTRMARWTRSANAALGADGLCVTASGLKISHGDLKAEILRWIERAHAV